MQSYFVHLDFPGQHCEWYLGTGVLVQLLRGHFHFYDGYEANPRACHLGNRKFQRPVHLASSQQKIGAPQLEFLLLFE